MRTTLVHSGSSASLAGIFGLESKVDSDVIIGRGYAQEGQETKEPKSRGRLDGVLRNPAVRRIFPILTWAPEYNAEKAICDLIAGVTVGLTVLPQGLAYANVAGLPPVYGLYSSFVGCFIYLFFGGTRAVTVGPSAINCVTTRKYTYGRPPEYAVLLCFVTGVVTLMVSIFQLGFISNFISTPVNSAFTTAVSLTIISTQMKGLFGISFHGEGFIPATRGFVGNVNNIKEWDTIMSLTCCTCLIFLELLPNMLNCMRKTHPKAHKAVALFATARNAIVIVVATLVVYFMRLEGTVALVGEIPPGLPAFKPPPFTIFNAAENVTMTFMDMVRADVSGFIVLPFLGVMGHMSIAKALSDTDLVDSTQETLSVGLSNIISSFFSSMPIGASLSRSTLNYHSGVKTPLGGLYTGTIVVLALELFCPYFYYIPKSSLGAVTVCSVIHAVDFKILLALWRCKKTDLIPWLITFVITITLGLEVGMLVGVLLSSSFLLYYAARPRVKILKGETSTGSAEFIIIGLDRSLTFPSVDYIGNEIIKAAKTYCAHEAIPIVIDCHHIQFADFTAAAALRDLLYNLNVKGYSVIFWKLKPSVERIVGSAMKEMPFVFCSTDDELESILEKGEIQGNGSLKVVAGRL